MIRELVVSTLFAVIMPVHDGDITPEDGYDCFTEPTTIADIGSPLRGDIERLLLDRCHTVSKDQPLSQHDSLGKQIIHVASLARLHVEDVPPANLFRSVQVAMKASVIPKLDIDRPLTAPVDADDALLDKRGATFSESLRLTNAELTNSGVQKRRVGFISGSVDLELAEKAG